MPGFTIISVFFALTVLPMIYISRRKAKKVSNEKENE
ncbi:MAG: Heimdall-CTERM domain-containing surface protein [Candidatus Thorarchaeota archaeon]